MTIIEGETVSHTVDIRAIEMAVIDTSDPEFDQIVTLPGHQLTTMKKISDEKLPFDVECVKFFPNSDIKQITSENPADSGVGLQFEAFQVPSTAGTDSDQMADYGSAYVKLTTKDGKPLGTHLISQVINDSKADSIEVDGKTYRIMLRFETEYKPYSMTLNDATVENYIGTNTPKFYSSDVVLNDKRNDVTSEQKIWMNNPLRYSDETFYQSGMNETRDGRGLTILQVVKNKGWMIPYVCCMFTVVGLVAQFGSSLLGFLEKARKREEKPATLSEEKVVVADLAADTKPGFSWARTWIPAIVLVLIFGVWTLGEMRKGSKEVLGPNDMRLDLLGQIPITINGRVQPLDSFARNTARQLGKREFVFGADENRKPAIQWMADTMFEAEGYLDYRIFRIEDLTVLNALDLPQKFVGRRGEFRYTLGELLEADSKLRAILPNPAEKDPKTWSPYENRISLVGQMLQRVFGAKLAFGSRVPEDADILVRLEEAADKFSSPLIPLVVPNDDPAQPWLPTMEAANKAWISKLAHSNQVSTTSELANALIKNEILPPLREDTLRQRIIQRFLADPEFLKVMEKQHAETNPEVLAKLMEQNWDKFPKQIRDELYASEGPLVDALLAQQMPRFTGVIEKQGRSRLWFKGPNRSGI